ncbi:MAG: single-stranded DNA-binding protein [Puniceicoccales bacterium]|jgi:single-strand DNA-binding protein|nr:single-stranded DNA-binding protein [Puniceicoccales bacterium]
MGSFNKVLLMGNLTRDPELRVTQGGMSICKFSVATSRQSKAADGTAREETVFIDVDAFGKQAEVIAKYFAKGRQIFVEGRLRLDQWENQSGEKRSKLGVVLEGFQFIGPRSDEDTSGQFAGAADAQQEAVAPAGLVEDLSRSKKSSAPRPLNIDVQMDENVPF